ncbi:MAG TPA: hypothetical protein VG797_04545 [Phycisphaerales bacterium]|nr:hypothetical protein [Phycisphaerales bacterium]
MTTERVPQFREVAKAAAGQSAQLSGYLTDESFWKFTGKVFGLIGYSTIAGGAFAVLSELRHPMLFKPAYAAAPVGMIVGLLVSAAIVPLLLRTRLWRSMIVCFLPTAFVAVAVGARDMGVFIVPLCVFVFISTAGIYGLASYLYTVDRPTWRCRKCGYDLRRLRSDRCPECGTPRPIISAATTT